jgi:alkylation response protein AidB-like acyl-CoA dehydrogenase
MNAGPHRRGGDDGERCCHGKVITQRFDPGAPSSVRKLIGVRYRQALAEIITDSYDGSGIVESPDVRYLLNSRCLSTAGGTEQILLTLAGKRLLGLPA